MLAAFETATLDPSCFQNFLFITFNVLFRKLKVAMSVSLISVEAEQKTPERESRVSVVHAQRHVTRLTAFYKTIFSMVEYITFVTLLAGLQMSWYAPKDFTQ